MNECYLGLGSNIGDSYRTLCQALKAIEKLDLVCNFTASRFFITTPVSDIPQNDFLNVVCRFHTALDVSTLHKTLKDIETLLGKTAKSKNAPRPIDIDILFFGSEEVHTEELTIPHPLWMQRLFVLKPLLDLTKSVVVYDPLQKALKEVDLELLLANFINIHHEKVVPLPCEK